MNKVLTKYFLHTQEPVVEDDEEDDDEDDEDDDNDEVDIEGRR